MSTRTRDGGRGRDGRDDPPADYRAEVRAVEDAYHELPRPAGRVIGDSVWWHAPGRLAAIGERHGVTPDDPRVYSIAAYKADLADLEADHRSAPPDSLGDGPRESIRHEARRADCVGRHFTGLCGPDRVKPGRIDTRPKLWFYLTSEIDFYFTFEAGMAARGGPDFWKSHLNRAVQEVYSALTRVGPADLVPKPPWSELTVPEALATLKTLADRLEETERPSNGPGSKLSPPSEKATQSYRCRLVTGAYEKDIAFTVYGDAGKQYQVSRDLAAVEKWIKAGNLLPPLDEPKPKTITVDPRNLDMGPRKDKGRRPRE